MSRSFRVLDNQADCFLRGLLNEGWSDGTAHFVAFSEWLARHPVFRPLLPIFPHRTPDFGGFLGRLEVWREEIRKVWMTESVEARSAAAADLPRLYFEQAVFSEFSTNTPRGRRAAREDGFMQVLYRLRDIAPRTRVCQNPRCRRPFFLADLKTQIYCSRPCGNFGKRASKRQWWQDHGRAWRRRKLKRNAGKSQRGGK